MIIISKIHLILLTLTLAANAEVREMSRLRSQRDAQVAKIDRIYIRELEKVKIKYTKAADLQSAIAVQKEIDKFNAVDSGGEDKQDKQKASVDFSKETLWKWGARETFTIRPQGRCRHSGWGGDGKWLQDAKDKNLIHVTFAHKAYTIEFRGGRKAVIKNLTSGTESRLELIK